MKKRKKINFWLQTMIAVFLTIIILFLGTIAIETLSFQLIVDRFVIPLLRLMLFIAIGLFVGQTIEAAGWTQHIASLARPLFRFGYLGDLSSAAFTTAFFFRGSCKCHDGCWNSHNQTNNNCTFDWQSSCFSSSRNTPSAPTIYGHIYTHYGASTIGNWTVFTNF
jgi:hypothetical protein